jgi:hypothetical protein
MVYDLSRLTAAEAVSLLEARDYNACVRLSRRADGTVRTRDCRGGATGRSGWWRPWALAASWLGWLFLSGCAEQGKTAPPPPKKAQAVLPR